MQPWTDFVEPVAGTIVSAELFGLPVHQDLYHVRQRQDVPCTALENLIQGDVVVIAGAGDRRVTKTTTLGQDGPVGVVQYPIPDDGTTEGAVRFGGVTPVNCDGGVTTNQYLRPSGTDGMLIACDRDDAGCCALALADSVSPTGGQVQVLLLSPAVGDVASGGGGPGPGGGGASGYVYTKPPAATGWSLLNNVGTTLVIGDTDEGLHINNSSDAANSNWRGATLPLTWPPTGFDQQFVLRIPHWGDPSENGPFIGIGVTDGTNAMASHLRWKLTSISWPGWYVQMYAVTNLSGTGFAPVPSSALIPLNAPWEPHIVRLRWNAPFLEWLLSLDGGHTWLPLVTLDTSTSGWTPDRYGVMLRNFGISAPMDVTLRHLSTISPAWVGSV